MSLWVDKHRPSLLNKLDYHRDQAALLKKLVSCFLSYFIRHHNAFEFPQNFRSVYTIHLCLVNAIRLNLIKSKYVKSYVINLKMMYYVRICITIADFHCCLKLDFSRFMEEIFHICCSMGLLVQEKRHASCVC